MPDCPSATASAKPRNQIDLDQINLPDPVEMELTKLRMRIAALEAALQECEDRQEEK